MSSPPGGRRAAPRPQSRRQRTRQQKAVSTPTEPKAPRTPRESWLSHRTPWLVWCVVLLAGAVALGCAAAEVGPGWLDGAGAIAVISAYTWALAARTGGRPLVFAGLAALLGVVTVVTQMEVLTGGAAVLTCVVSGVLAVMMTVPASSYLLAVRETLIASGIAAVGAFATVGFEPNADRERFEYVTLAIGFLLVLVLVFRFGAGLHGLGRRGLVIVLVGSLVLVLTIAYAELLRRYGISSVVEPALDVVRWSREHLGAFPRPIVVLLGIPALVWGVHMRARRRQGWWVCAFGVAATLPVAQSLVNPLGSFLEAALQTVYGVLLGLVVGYVVIRLDLALTGPRGSRARAAEAAAAHRPEPSRFRSL
ncbi:hypothetical protein [Nocardioides sp. InS609-2]|uniref:hypothetical protein n=1 Tax=Nocardioides sp. InS609-2 TaxID=2760705 RepID=UPI0020BEDF1E|nr:hypothetical protein [Nocardioides sp. InS609-2]